MLPKILLVTLVSLAFAGPEDRRAAEQHLERGIEAANAHRVDEAIAEFQAGYARFPNPALLFNLGLVYQAAGRDADALSAFEQFIAEAQPLLAEHAQLAASLEVARTRAQALRQALGRAGPADPAPSPAPPPSAPSASASTRPLPPAAPPPAAPATLDLVRQPPAPEPPRSHLKWWLIGAGAVVVGAATTWFLLSRDRCAPNKYDVGCI